MPVITIRYFESSGHQQLMYLEDRQEPVPISSKMQKLETELASEGFLSLIHILRLEIYPHRTYLYIMCRNTCLLYTSSAP